LIYISSNSLSNFIAFSSIGSISVLGAFNSATFAGGITEITKGLYKSKEKIDFKRLYDYCKCFNAQSVIKRLGFLLELLEINNPVVDKLLKFKTNSFILLELGYEKKGSLPADGLFSKT
jgi:predicted transcriptional regulator of viral defense system